MAATMSVSAVIAIPTYNNRATLRGVAGKALATGLPVVVVDDGSTDGAMDTLDGLAVERIAFPHNRGKGEAIRAAGSWAAERGFSHVVTLDADGQHDPADVARFLPRIERDPLTILVGCREFDREANVPGSSRFGRAWSNMWLRIASGAACRDSQSGFRAYPIEALTQIATLGSRYNFEVEVLARAAWAGLRIDSVDVSVRYFEGAERVSHFRPFVDNLRISLTYTWLVARNLLPWPHRVLYNDPAPIEISIKHPIRFWRSVWRRLFVKLGDEQNLSLRHPIRSLRLLHLERTTPLEIALACMLGIFLGALPLIGCHTPAIFFYATRFKLSRPIAFYASQLCAPFLPPFVPALCVEAGYFMRFGRFLTLADLNSKAALFQTLCREAHLRLWEYFLGSLVVGPALAVIVGAAAYFLASRAQARRRKRTRGE